MCHASQSVLPFQPELEPYPHSPLTQGGWVGEQERLGPVLMVYSLDPDRFNCGKLFNLLCLYGNVVKINFLKVKENLRTSVSPQCSAVVCSVLQQCTLVL